MNGMPIEGLILLLATWALTMIVGPFIIRWIKSHQVQQPIRSDGPQSHATKVGTPTMGGLIFLLSITCVTVYSIGLSLHKLAPLLLMLFFGFVGFVDDWRKIKRKSHKGLSGKARLVVESIAAFVFCWCLTQHGDYQTFIHIPFMADTLMMSPFVYCAFSTLVIVGTANAVNLTDGLDGLAIVPISLVAGFLAFAAIGTYQTGLMSSTALLLFSTIGAGIGFLWFNANPARIFMGDIGSLALGGLLGGAAVVLNLQIYLLIVGALFVVETLSVIIQVVSYKLRKKRVFKMAPIHHHFELSGWTENQVTIRAWIFAFLSVALGFIALGYSV